MEALGILGIIVVAFFAFGDLATLGALWVNRNDPEQPPPDSQDPLNKDATVTCEFGGESSAMPSNGKVELNGVSWSARTELGTSSFHVGEKVRVTSRDGLVLLVRPTNDA